MSRKYYAKLTSDSFGQTSRYADGTPHNFTIVSFSSPSLRAESLDRAWEEGFNLINIKRSELLSTDLIIHFDSIKIFDAALKLGGYKLQPQTICSDEIEKTLNQMQLNRQIEHQVLAILTR
ncbi:MAG: hypothetical protein OXG15_12625 [Gammaproteobacteria bacterium]|nr:hypothetical protein [Gammaproteobacteria bacterium]